MSSRCVLWLVAAGLVCLAVPKLRAGPIRSGFASSALVPIDDDSSPATNLGFSVNFFGNLHDQVYVNTNGNITFGSALFEYTPFDLTSTHQQIVAPFFADVDLRGSGAVTYGTGVVAGRSAFAATWDNVGYYNAKSDKTNSFQVVLVDRSDTGAGNFDIEFNYNKIAFETGDASGGTNGLGGSSARAGFSNGSGLPGTSLELPGSAVNGAFLDGGSDSLTAGCMNSDVAGRYVFYARNGVIDDNPTTDPPPVVETAQTPEPATLVLAGLGIAGTWTWAWRKRKV